MRDAQEETGEVMGVAVEAGAEDVMETGEAEIAVTDQDLGPEADAQGQATDVTDQAIGGIVPETGVTVLDLMTETEAVKPQDPRADLKSGFLAGYPAQS